MRIKSDKCSRCKINLRASKCRYCLWCKAQYMKEWRKVNIPTETQRLRNNARSYLRVYVKRGKIPKGSCEVCNSPLTIAYFLDYSKPLEVIWRCKEHKPN